MNEADPELQSDLELEWMAKLDWSLHGPKGRKFTSDHMPIGEAAALFAEHAAGPFWQHELPFHLEDAALLPRGKWIDAQLAYGENGLPTSLYHDRLELALLHARKLSIPLQSPSTITKAEWNIIDEQGAEMWSLGEAARRLWSQLAPAIARLAAEAKIVTYARPVGGGDELLVEAKLWKLDPDTAIARLARCGFDAARPFDGSAEPTHHLFVSRIGLGKTLMDAARENYMVNFAVGYRCPRPIDELEPSHSILTASLRRMILENPLWNREQLHEALQKKFACEIGPRPFLRMRKQIKAEDSKLAVTMSKTGPKVG